MIPAMAETISIQVMGITSGRCRTATGSLSMGESTIITAGVCGTVRGGRVLSWSARRLVVPYLPPFYATVWVGSIPYYYANSVYYVSVPGGYAVVDPPQGPLAELPLPPSEQVFVYPRKGQDEAEQADDKYACHKWATGQTGFDPTLPPDAGLEGSRLAQKRSDYQRAMAACLEGRGYTVR